MASARAGACAEQPRGRGAALGPSQPRRACPSCQSNQRAPAILNVVVTFTSFEYPRDHPRLNIVSSRPAPPPSFGTLMPRRTACHSPFSAGQVKSPTIAPNFVHVLSASEIVVR
jgi:hypothetical protein